MKLLEIFMDHKTKKDEISPEDWDEFIDDAQPVKGGKIKGYDIYISHLHEPDIVLLVKDPDSEGFLGALTLMNNGKFYNSEIFFDSSIQGKGIAVPLYVLAIKLGYTLVSDKTQTKGSKALWAKLAYTRGIDVYGWDYKNDKFFHWDPKTDPDEEVYTDQESDWQNADDLAQGNIDILDKYKKGQMNKADYKHYMTQNTKERNAAYRKVDQNMNMGPGDIRLVATRK